MKRPSLFRYGVLATTVLVGVGCSFGPQQADEQQAARGLSDDPIALASERGIPVGIEALSSASEDGSIADPSALQQAAEAAGLSKDQVSALEDGVVEFGEYEGLFSSGLECARSRGVAVAETGEYTDPFSHVTTLTYGVPSSGDTDEDRHFSSIVAACMTKHVTPAEALYVRQNEPPQEEIDANTERAFLEYYRCLLLEGTDLPEFESMTYDDLLAYTDIVPECKGP